jgi:AcrR family transcriptional regulator
VPRGRRNAETRQKVEDAAGQLFSTRGYEATTMQAIADLAGVHVQTIYLSYGTKPAVLAAAATRLVAGEDGPESHPSERRWAKQITATDDPARKLALYVHHIGDVARRIVPLVDMLRASGPVHPEVASFLARMNQGRWEGPYALFEPLASAGELRAGLTRASAADIAYALASPDTLRALVEDRGWTWKRAEVWVSDQLEVALLRDQNAG